MILDVIIPPFSTPQAQKCNNVYLLGANLKDPNPLPLLFPASGRVAFTYIRDTELSLKFMKLRGLFRCRANMLEWKAMETAIQCSQYCIFRPKLR